MTTAKDYRTLVNDAMRESGANLDTLTTSTFSSSTDSLHLKFKQWVNQAYREMQMERRDWKKSTELVYKPLRPRLLVNTTATPAPTNETDYILGQESEADAQVIDYKSAAAESTSGGTLSTLWTASVSPLYLELKDVDGKFKFGENIDRTNSAGTVQTADWASVVGFGRYDLTYAMQLRNTARSIFEPIKDSFYIAQGTEDQATNSSDYDNDGTVRNRKLDYIPWITWQEMGLEEETSAVLGEPCYFTEDPTGLYDFFPRPNTEYRLRYYAQIAIDELSAHGDTPDLLPNDFHDAIFWRAVTYYAQHERKQELLRISADRYAFYKTRMEDLLGPEVTWGRKRIY